MTVNETSATSNTSEVPSIANGGMPSISERAINYSADYICEYEDQHVNEALSMDEYAIALLGVARLQLILEQVRLSLSGMFTEYEFMLLINCFQGDIFCPDQICRIASELCDDLGVDIDSYKTSGIAALVGKIQDLSVAQRVALADALEQTWHRGLTCNQTPQDFLSELGIELAE